MLKTREHNALLEDKIDFSIPSNSPRLSIIGIIAKVCFIFLGTKIQTYGCMREICLRTEGEAS